MCCSIFLSLYYWSFYIDAIDKPLFAETNLCFLVFLLHHLHDNTHSQVQKNRRLHD